LKHEHDKLALREGYLSILVNILLFGLKFWAGIVSGSIALISDAWHSLSDSISSLAIIIGVKISSKPPDKAHPFGHGRAELITSLIIGMLLAFVAFDFLKESFTKFGETTRPNFGIIALSVTIFSLIAKELSAQYAFHLARKTGNLAIKADGWHHRSDALSTLLILIGIFVNKYFIYTDAVLGILISLMILHSAYLILKESARAIMGTATDEGTIKQITETANEIAGFDVFVHKVNTHKYGRYIEITFHIKLPGDFTVKKADKIINEFRKEIRQKLEIETIIHIDSL